MKTILIAAFAALAFVTSALAGDDDVMASRYGNTTVVTMANGTVTKIWYSADHTWTGTTAGQASAGTWKIEGGKLCVSWNNPPPNMTAPVCAEAKLRQVGETWTAGSGAAQMSVTLVEGHQ